YTERLTKELQLSSEQQKKVYDLTLERATKAKERGAVQRGDMNQDRMQEMRAERKAHQDKLEGILTPEQLKTWNESRARVMKNRSDRNRGENMKRVERSKKDKSSSEDKSEENK